MLGQVIYGNKIIPTNYGSISHLPGSKMINNEDKLLGKQETLWLTKRRNDPADLVIITEKVDGMNAGVLRQRDVLYPLVRRGYDARTNPMSWIKAFANYVEDNYNRFMGLLDDGERLCGEWMIKTHTVEYNLKTEPFIVYDLINGSRRERYLDFHKRVISFGFTPAGLVHIGEAMTPKTALRIMKGGYHGAVDQPEGIVYKYESAKTGYVCSGKYVAHPNVGKDEFFKADDLNAWNHVKSKYKAYINECIIHPPVIINGK